MIYTPSLELDSRWAAYRQYVAQRGVPGTSDSHHKGVTYGTITSISAPHTSMSVGDAFKTAPFLTKERSPDASVAASPESRALRAGSVGELST